MLVTRNVYGRTAGRNMTDDQMGRMARLMVVALAIVALYLSIFKSTALVDLLLSGYMGVTQFFPMIVLGLFWKKSTKAAAFASLIVGEGLVFYLLILNKMSIVAVPALGGHVNTGFLALVVNIAVFVVVSLVTNKSDDDVLRA